jgi:D-alanyl-D-alanine carboxypeptidase/D-alanyl-D-alanine-endopeptidase (penicillin-binding protein 4)
MKFLITFLLIFLVQTSVIPQVTDKLINELDNLLAEVPSSTKMAILIYNPLTQDTIKSINHTESMIPASNTKLFTSATALELMGGEYLISTKIFVDDDDLSDGTINGNIYIKGYGNPTFTSDDLEDLVDELYQSGLRKVTGNVVGDDNYFDEVYSRDDWITDERANVNLPPISAIVIDRNRTIVRKKRRGRYRNYFVNVENPPLYVANKFREKLIKYGIEVTGKSISSETPDTAIAIIESAIELNELIQLINKNSDNFYAECLFKTLGAVYSGKQGNSFFSTQAILNYIEDAGIYSDGTKIVDGSGISRFDQVTAGALVGLLEKMYFNINKFEYFYNSLSIAGVDGTLHKRMIGTAAENNFRGKTGTLNGVSSISGYVKNGNDDDIIICLMFEFKKGGASKYKRIQDRIIETIARWKDESPEIKSSGP